MFGLLMQQFRRTWRPSTFRLHDSRHNVVETRRISRCSKSVISHVAIPSMDCGCVGFRPWGSALVPGASNLGTVCRIDKSFNPRKQSWFSRFHTFESALVAAMGPAAEVIFFPVKPNIDPSELLGKATQILSAQKDFRAAYYGPLVEDGKIHCLVLEWKDRAAIEAWTKVYDAKMAKELFEAIVDMEAGLEPYICK